jgi:hypothetical protein
VFAFSQGAVAATNNIITTAARVRVTISRAGTRPIRVSQAVRSGRRTLRLRAPQRPGRYTLTLSADTSDGQRAPPTAPAST